MPRAQELLRLEGDVVGRTNCTGILLPLCLCWFHFLLYNSMALTDLKLLAQSQKNLEWLQNLIWCELPLREHQEKMASERLTSTAFYEAPVEAKASRFW